MTFKKYLILGLIAASTCLVGCKDDPANPTGECHKQPNRIIDVKYNNYWINDLWLTINYTPDAGFSSTTYCDEFEFGYLYTKDRRQPTIDDNDGKILLNPKYAFSAGATNVKTLLDQIEDDINLGKSAAEEFQNRVLVFIALVGDGIPLGQQPEFSKDLGLPDITFVAGSNGTAVLSGKDALRLLKENWLEYVISDDNVVKKKDNFTEQEKTKIRNGNFTLSEGFKYKIITREEDLEYVEAKKFPIGGKITLFYTSVGRETVYGDILLTNGGLAVKTPVVKNGTLDNSTYNSFEVNASEVDLDGGSAITEYGIVYSTTESDIAAGSGTYFDKEKGVSKASNFSFDANVTGMDTMTTYYYAAYAKNGHDRIGFGATSMVNTSAVLDASVYEFEVFTPLANATLTIKKDGKVVTSGTSNADGLFLINQNLPKGSYTYELTLSGYYTVEDNLEVDNKLVNLWLEMVPM